MHTRKMLSGAGYQATSVVDAESGRVLVSDCARACTRATARKGLLGLSGLPAGSGLLLGEGLVHMLGMRFPLDLVFISRGRTVLAVSAGVHPGWRVRAHVRARYTLELPVGAGADFVPGQRLIF
jgi:uncharacterized membrane protein (UPF0127 family)